MKVIIVGGGQVGNGGQGVEEAPVIALHSLHPGLLQHDLREPHVVRLPVPAPRQIPAMAFVPGQQHAGQPCKEIGHNGASFLHSSRSIPQPSPLSTKTVAFFPGPRYNGSHNFPAGKDKPWN